MLRVGRQRDAGTHFPACASLELSQAIRRMLLRSKPCQKAWSRLMSAPRKSGYMLERNRRDQLKTLAPEHHVGLKQLQPGEVALVRAAPVGKRAVAFALLESKGGVD